MSRKGKVEIIRHISLNRAAYKLIEIQFTCFCVHLVYVCICVRLQVIARVNRCTPSANWDYRSKPPGGRHIQPQHIDIHSHTANRQHADRHYGYTTEWQYFSGATGYTRHRILFIAGVHRGSMATGEFQTF